MSAIAAASGFADAPLDSQRVFRSLLQAMSEPGTVRSIAALLQSPAPLGLAQAAAALTLFDNETTVWLSPRLRVPAVTDFLRFQTGAPIVDDPAKAAFALSASVAELLPLSTFRLGSDEAPESSVTIIAEVAVITAGSGRILRGPGIPGTRALELRDVPDDFWLTRASVCALVPCGLDFIFTSDESLVALPRTTQVEG